MNAIAQSAAATPADWARFLKPVAMAVRNTPSDDEFRARVSAVSHAVKIPAAWLAQPWKQAEAMRAWQFWPSVHDVFALFEDELREARADAARRSDAGDLRQIAAPAAQTLTDEERAAIAAKARAVAAELRGGSIANKPEKVTARPLSPTDLVATYRRLAAEGNRLAATRLASLEPEA